MSSENIILLFRTVPQPPHKDVSAAADDYSTRLSTFKEMCSKYGTDKFYTAQYPIVYSREFSFAYCIIPKTGTTTFAKQLAEFMPINTTLPKNENTIHNRLKCKNWFII